MCQRCNIESPMSASVPPSFRRGPVASIFPCSWQPSFRPLASSTLEPFKETARRRLHLHRESLVLPLRAGIEQFAQIRIETKYTMFVIQAFLQKVTHRQPRRANGDGVQNQHPSQARHVKMGAHAEDHGGRVSSRRLVVWSLFGTAVTANTPAR